MSTEDLSPVPQERRLALVIGVNEAPRSHLEPLNYALKDAEAMAQVLQEQCGFTLLQPPLLGADATSANVRKAVLALARQRTDADFLLLYFSGHGQPMTVSGDQSDIYLATSDFSESETEEDETLHCSMRWLQDKLYLPTQAGKVLLVLDCCYAGNMGRTASDPYLEDLKARIHQYFGAPGSASVARSGGLRLALTATGHNRPAYEKDGHGTLTGWLLECLRGEIDEVIDLDNRGNVSLQRLHDYLLRVMPAKQNPSVAGDYAGRSCILAQYEQRANELRQQKRAIVNERPHTHIPLNRSTSFQRRPELETLARLLFAESGEASSPHTAVVGLIGMGGIGKTQLAVEMAYEYKERFPAGVFWTPAIGTTLPEWQRQFADLAANTDYLPSGDDDSHPENEARRARHVCRYLAQHSDALLLLDNVERIEDLLNALATFAGEEVLCTILYTSRTDQAPPDVQKYPVGKLPDEGALRLLLARRSALLKRILAGERDPEADAAREICHYVEGLPLALILLRDLLQDTHLTLVHLQQELRRRGVLAVTSDEDVTKARLFSTFFLSWEKVHSPAAQRFFKLASYFPEASPISLWLLALAANLQGNTSLEPLGKARLELLRWSLIEELPNDAIRLHPLVREFAQRLIALDPGQSTLLTEARERLTSQFAQVNDLEQRALDEGYWKCLEHVQEVAKYVQLLEMDQKDLLERIEYWLARDSSLLGNSGFWPDQMPSLFYQQLFNRALEEGYILPGRAPDARWVRQQARVGIENLALLREFRHPTGVTNVALSLDIRLVVTSCEDNRVRVWDASSGQMLQVWRTSDALTGIAFSPDGRTVVTCSLNIDAQLWNILNGQLIQTFHGHTDGLLSVIFSPDGKQIATMSRDRTVRIWDAANGEMLALFVGPADTPGNIAFSPDGKRIALISSDTIDLWDIASEQALASLRMLIPDEGARWRIALSPSLAEGARWGIAFSPDGKSLLSGLDKELSIWNIERKEISARLFGDLFLKHDIISNTVFSSDTKRLAVISGTMVEVFQIPDGQMLLTCGHNTAVSSAAFSLDGTKIATGAFDGTVRIWQIVPMPMSKTTPPQSFPEPIESIVFSSAGTEAITLNSKSLMQVWNVAHETVLRTLQVESRSWPYHIAISRDGKKVAVEISGGIRIWDMEQGQEVAVLISPSWYHHIAFSPDGLSIAAATDRAIEIWSLETREVTAELQGYEGSIRQIVFSPDGHKLIVGTTDSTVRIWEIASHAQLAALKEYAGRSLSVSPDGSLIALGILGNEVHICSLDTGKRQLVLKSHTHPITALSFSPSGRLLISADRSGQVLFWRVDEPTPGVPQGVYLAANEIAAIHWQDEQHLILADRGGTDNHPHFYHLALEGDWSKIF